ncbi:MAG TPA: hypothetical protein VN577_10240 [Terriglobales bacterium]|nr:hypothetical protein [Terriglobales bacterium]
MDSQFGEGFKVDPKFHPLPADFDGDGVEDVAIVTFGKDPLARSADKNYKVVDPYDEYFGFGDAKVTARFSGFGDGTSHCVNVIHDWRNQKPKAKFVIINLPFESLGLGTVPYKKRTVTGIAAKEGGGLNALVFWDGKKYRWEPSEFSNDADLPR